MLLKVAAAGATLSLGGIGEGAQILLAPAATTNLTITASASVGTPSVSLSLERSGQIVANATVAPPYSVTFSNLSSGKYYLSAAIVGEATATADISFDIRPSSQQPPNDLWSQATAMTVNGAALFGTNTYATSEPKEPLHADNAGGRSMWWKWTAPSNGLVTITTAGSSFDTVLAVYTGTNVGLLKPMVANDDAGSTNRSSQVTFVATNGTTYYVAVDGALLSNGLAANGVVALNAFASAPPSVSISFPPNGFSMRVSTALPTNLNTVATIADPSGLQHVEYALDKTGTSNTGTLTPPYQWNLQGLLPGDYLLTVTAINNLGLISSSHVSFSIVSSAPRILLVDTPPLTQVGFQFAVEGLKGTTYAIQSATNVPAWSSLLLWTNFDGVQRVLDTNSPQSSARFYRAIIP